MQIQGSSIPTRTQGKREATGRTSLAQSPRWPCCALGLPAPIGAVSTPFPSPHILLLQFPLYKIKSLTLLFGPLTTVDIHSLTSFHGAFSPFLARGALPEAAGQVTPEKEKQLSCWTAISIMNFSTSGVKLIAKQSVGQQTLKYIY